MRASPLIGAALVLAGGAMMAGWLFQLPGIVRLLPGFLMVFNTAFGFALAGAALAAGLLAPVARERARTAAGLALVALGTLVLAQHLTGARLGIDWPALHAWTDAGANPFPGRMSPAASVGFIFAGAVFLLLPRMRRDARVVLPRALTAALAALGAMALAGHGLKLADILDAYWFAQVSLPTAAGFVLLASGLWLDWRGEPWNAYRLIAAEDDRIAFAGALVLAGCIVAAGTGVFWLMLSQMERTLAADLVFVLKSRHALLGASIQRAVLQAAEVAERPNPRRLYPLLADPAQAAESRAVLLAIASGTLKSGFSAFAFLDTEGREIVRAGEFLAASALHMPLARGAGGEAELLWDGDFLLQTRADVIKDGVRLGQVRGQHRLADLRGIMLDAADLNASSELGLCRLRAGKLHCAPTRLQPRVFDIPLTVGGNRLPMSYALEGGSGVQRLTDYRGKRVLAAYAPFEALGAALVLKSDLDDLFAPIRERLGYVALVLLLASVAGGWLLRTSVGPLARRLAGSEARLRMALESSQFAVWDWDIRGGQVHLSERWSEMLGGPPRGTTIGFEALRAQVHPEDAAELRDKILALLKGTISHYSVEHRVRARSGEWLWIRSRGQVVERAPDGQAVRAIGTNADISERKREELQVAHRATHDALTGLPNRSMFQDRLAQAIQRGRRSKALMAAMYLDVDKFKAVNDTLGHAAGDELLKEFARRLAACVRASDTVARIGGDEFAVILENLGARDDGERMAGNIVAAMRPAFALDGHAASVGVSVGIAFRDAADRSAPEELLKAADAALYEAKSTGRDRYRVAASSEAAAGAQIP